MNGDIGAWMCQGVSGDFLGAKRNLMVTLRGSLATEAIAMVMLL